MEGLYYPNIQIESNEWLKFALLYFSRVHIIVPPGGLDDVPEWYRKIIYSTNLIEEYTPRIEHAHQASRHALQQVEQMLRFPNSYGDLFSDPKLVDNWKDQSNHSYVLYEQKYSHDWEQFCTEEGLGHYCDKGIEVHPTLGKLYMTLFAEHVSLEENIPTVTDSITLYDTAERITNAPSVGNRQIEETIRRAKTLLYVYLPEHLNNIEFRDIVELRNSPGFIELLQAFHTEQDNLYRFVENGSRHRPDILLLRELISEIAKYMLNVSPSVVAFSLQATTTMNTPRSVLDTVFTGLGAVSTVIRPTKSLVKSSRSRVLARKYLINVQRNLRRRKLR